MIDFRYHLVSLVAVFLALATGLVLGSTVLNDMVLRSTTKTADDLNEQNTELRGDLRSLENGEQTTQKFVETVAPTLLADELKDKRVVVFAAPGSDHSQVREVTDGVRLAGGTVTGTVSLRNAYVDKQKVGVLGGLTDTLGKNTELDMPTGAIPAERAAYLLANATVTDDEAGLGKTDDNATGTLTAFEEAKFLDTSGAPQKRAELALVVGPAETYRGERTAAANDAMLALARELDSTGSGAVLTAPEGSAGQGGVVSALRDDTAEKSVSTVDNLDSPPGYVVSVLALALDGNGSVGHWGSGSGSDAIAPSPSAQGNS